LLLASVQEPKHSSCTTYILKLPRGSAMLCEWIHRTRWKLHVASQ
jgi:hypothetical protein